jgi:hypothetical protein
MPSLKEQTQFSSFSVRGNSRSFVAKVEKQSQFQTAQSLNGRMGH